MPDRRIIVEIVNSGKLPLQFNPDICNGCNVCVEICQVDVLLPHPEKGNPPIVAFGDECWYDGSCVAACPREGAIKLKALPKNSVHVKRKTTGEDFYIK